MEQKVQTFKLELEEGMVIQVLQSLAKQPYEVVAKTIKEIEAQVAPQVEVQEPKMKAE
jgi:hypothetical protein